MKRTLKEQWIELAKMRGWVSDKIPAETEGRVKEALFEAQQSLGYAMLQLERIDFYTDGAYSDSDPIFKQEQA
jgi:hypothetical protein